MTTAFPRAEIVVHEGGAAPGRARRLLASARRVYGDVLDTVFGELLATPAERIDTSGGTGTVELGDRRALRSTYSPVTPRPTSG